MTDEADRGAVTPRRALISVSDKRGLVELATRLVRKDVEIISTGGSARVMREAGLPVTDVSEVTGFPEMLAGRVKTLHPHVHAGILFRRDVPSDVEILAEHGIGPIDLVVVNLYPFEETVAAPDTTRDEAIEQIDIGGPSLIRAAAKNHAHVTVVTSPDDYADVADAVESGGVTAARRRELAGRAFARCAAYDGAIASYLARVDAPQDAAPWPTVLLEPWRLERPLRYGENPHQPGAFYVPRTPRALGALTQLHGKPISYNNLLDLDGGWRLAQALAPPAAVVVKHRNPAGAAEAPDLGAAFAHAWAGDPLSAFGGVIVLRGRVDAALATAIKANFVEMVAAEAFDDAALEILRKKKNLVLVTSPGLGPGGEPIAEGAVEVRAVAGGLLAQASDRPGRDEPTAWHTATDRAPTDLEARALAFAWQVTRYVQSNAIVFVNGTRTVGVGCGQTSRIDAVTLAIAKARRAGHDLAGSVMASDAFFPFDDSVRAAAEVGCTAVVQPGGSKRDGDSIAAADAAGMAMVFTGRRSFRH